MIPVSTQYLAAQTAHEFEGVRKALLFRRLADGSDWESTPMDVTGEVLSMDRLSDKLDTDALNEFKSSNIAVTVDNSLKQWEQGGSRFAGRLLYRSKLQIWLGMVNSGGAPESFPRFTGVIEDVNEGSGNPSRVLTVTSSLVLAQTADADQAALVKANELLGIGDNETADFYSKEVGVGEFQELRVAGEVLRPGLRWAQSQLDDPDLPGKVTFQSTQPPSGAEVRADYIYWKKNLKIEEAVAELLATVPGMTIDVIEPVEFDPPAQREIVHTTEGDFSVYELIRAATTPEASPPQGDAALTLKPIETTAEFDSHKVAESNLNQGGRVPDGVHPFWRLQYEGDYLPEEEYPNVEGEPILPRAWSEFVPGTANRSVSGSVLHVHHSAGADYLITGQRGGGSSESRYFSIRIRFDSLDGDCFYGGAANFAPYRGAVLMFDTLNTVKFKSGPGSGVAVPVDLTQWHTFEVETNAGANVARLYVDGVMVAERPLGAVTGTSYGSVEFHSTTGGSNTFEIDFMRFNHLDYRPPLGSITLRVDYGPHLAGLTTFALITTLGGFFAEYQGAPRDMRYFYSWSQDGVSFSPEVEIPLGGDIGNWTNVDSPRYVDLRIEFRAGSDTLPTALRKLWTPGLVAVEVDGGDGAVSWDQWLQAFDNNDGLCRFFTASADQPSGSGYSFYAAVGPSGEILSDDNTVNAGFPFPPKLVFIGLLSTSGVGLPLFRESIIRLTTKTILISLANYGRDNSALSVIQEIAGLSDSEIGTNGGGAFFFRDKKIAAEPVKVLDDSNVIEVLAYNEGWDRVYNSIKASFGNFRKVANSASEGDPVPTSERRYGTRSLPVGGGSLMFQKDVDLATVMAKRYWTRYKEAKRRLTLKVRWMPELELGDRVYYDVQKPRRIGPATLDARVIGVALDPMGYTTELEIMEWP